MATPILFPAGPNGESELPPGIPETFPLETENTISTLWEIVARVMNRGATLKDESGSVLVEFAMCSIVLILLLLGGIDCALVERDITSVNWLAEQGAVCLSRASQGCSVQSYVASAGAGLGLVPDNLSVTIIGTRTVTVSYAFGSGKAMAFSPWFRNLNLSATASTS